MKLILKSPLKTFKVTQIFGNSNPTLYGNAGHNGIDLEAKHGTPIYSPIDGYASYQVDDGGGHGVVIITDKEYEYEGDNVYFKVILWHLPDPLKEPNLRSPIADKTGFVKVSVGDLVGFVDNTGKSTGDHLHFGLKPVAKGENWGTWYNLEQNNGYYGAIDPMPFMDLSDIPEYLKRANIRFGHKNLDVSIAQALLMAHGYKITIDGTFGQKTTDTVRAFQRKHNLVADGIIGTKSWEKLYTF